MLGSSAFFFSDSRFGAIAVRDSVLRVGATTGRLPVVRRELGRQRARHASRTTAAATVAAWNLRRSRASRSSIEPDATGATGAHLPNAAPSRARKELNSMSLPTDTFKRGPSPAALALLGAAALGALAFACRSNVTRARLISGAGPLTSIGQGASWSSRSSRPEVTYAFGAMTIGITVHCSFGRGTR